MLNYIERATRQKIEPMDLPSVQDINRNRVERFKDKICSVVAEQDLDFYSQLVAELQQQHELSSEQIAAASTFLAQGDTPLLLDERKLNALQVFQRFLLLDFLKARQQDLTLDDMKIELFFPADAETADILRALWAASASDAAATQ